MPSRVNRLAKKSGAGLTWPQALQRFQRVGPATWGPLSEGYLIADLRRGRYGGRIGRPPLVSRWGLPVPPAIIGRRLAFLPLLAVLPRRRGLTDQQVENGLAVVAGILGLQQHDPRAAEPAGVVGHAVLAPALIEAREPEARRVVLACTVVVHVRLRERENFASRPSRPS